jgi:hypothetical protein
MVCCYFIGLNVIPENLESCVVLNSSEFCEPGEFLYILVEEADNINYYFACLQTRTPLALSP